MAAIVRPCLGLCYSAVLSCYTRKTEREVGLQAGLKRMAKRKAVRLTEPMVRENGALRPASWDEALDRVSSGLQSAIKEQGPQTFGLFSCSKATNEVNYLAQKLTRAVIGSNNIDSCNRT